MDRVDHIAFWSPSPSFLLQTRTPTTEEAELGLKGALVLLRASPTESTARLGAGRGAGCFLFFIALNRHTGLTEWILLPPFTGESPEA